MGRIEGRVAGDIASMECVEDRAPKELRKNEKMHECSYSGCNASFARPSKLARHIRMHTGERPYVCSHPGCVRAYTNSSHLKRHARVHDVVKEVYRCPICFLTVSNASNLKRHVNRVHDNNRLSCTKCNMTFTKRYQLARHLYTHSDSMLYKCDKCSVSYTNLHKLERHKKTHMHMERTYACDISNCPEIFHKWAELSVHRKTKHAKDYVCTICGKSFLCKSHLRRHATMHSENRTVFPCPHDRCHRTYLFKRNLDQHIHSAHNGEKFYCDICSVGLSTKQKLAEHIERLHNSVKKKKPQRKSLQRKRRKDAGTVKKSAMSALIGVNLPATVEKALLRRDTPSMHGA